MASPRIVITPREWEAIAAAWSCYAVQYEDDEEDQPAGFAQDMAALQRVKTKWYAARPVPAYRVQGQQARPGDAPARLVGGSPTEPTRTNPRNT